MDPIANINEQMKLVRAMRDKWEFLTEEAPDNLAREYTRNELVSLGQELADLVSDLNQWRLKGGFDPYTAR